MEIIEQVRHTANILDIASQYTNLIRRGKRYLGLCPFHTEKTPSFTIDEDKQLYHCFGCGAGGDIFTLVMEKENVSFPEAFRYLAEKYHIPLPERKKLSPQYLRLEEQLLKACETALVFFNENLCNSLEGEKALKYLHKRKISDAVIQKLQLGYTPNSWDSLLTCCKEKNIPPDILEKAGLALRQKHKEKYYDRFRGRIIFPIFNLSEKVVAFGGRSLFNEEPTYLNSPDTPIYSKGKLLYGLNLCRNDIKEKNEVILVEGYMDFLSLYQGKVKNVVASLGTSLTENQVSLALRFAPRLIIGYDGDTAGRKAAIRAISLGFEKGAQVKVINLPEGQDPDSLIREKGVEEFNALIDKSIPALRFLIDSHLNKRKITIPEEKAKIARDIVQQIKRIPDSIIQSEYLRQAGEYLDIEESILRSMFEKKSEIQKSDNIGVLLPAEKRLLQIILEDSKIAAQVLTEITEKDFNGLKSESIFKIFHDYFKKEKIPQLHEIKEKIDPGLFKACSQILAEQSEQMPTVREARELIMTLKESSLDRQYRRLQAQLLQLEKKGEKEKIPLLSRKIINIKRLQYELSQRNY